MRNGTRVHSNALKHGAFAETAILPGEDQGQFAELHSRLIEEWTPVGPTEEDAVLSIAKCVWRKRRLQRFIKTKIMKWWFMPEHPAYWEDFALACAAVRIGDDPNTDFSCLRKDKVVYLLNKFPRKNFETTSAWVRAIQNEINSVLLPAAMEHPFTEPLVSEEVHPRDDFDHELAVEQRIDAMIDRAIKRLIQTKAMKQMLGCASPNGGDDQPKRLQSGKPNGSKKAVNQPPIG
jgi:hypothetical protein